MKQKSVIVKIEAIQRNWNRPNDKRKKYLNQLNTFIKVVSIFIKAINISGRHFYNTTNVHILFGNKHDLHLNRRRSKL